jgi:hypothetical protein
MLKGAVIAAAGVLAVAVFASAVTGPSAMAAAPKCKNKANKYVACTDKLKAKTQRKGVNFQYGKVDYRYRPTRAPAVVPSGSVRFRIDSPTPSGSTGLRP